MYTGIRPKQNNEVNIITHNLPDQLTEDARKFKGIAYNGITNLPYNEITNLQGILPCRLIQIQTAKVNINGKDRLKRKNYILAYSLLSFFEVRSVWPTSIKYNLLKLQSQVYPL